MDGVDDQPSSSAPDRRMVQQLTAAAAVAGVASPVSAAHLDIVSLDALSLARAIHKRKVSCAEVMGAYLDHIDAVNPKVNAIVALQDRGQLLRQARSRDADLASGKPVGLLHGFPHAVKDLKTWPHEIACPRCWAVEQYSGLRPATGRTIGGRA